MVHWKEILLFPKWKSPVSEIVSTVGPPNFEIHFTRKSESVGMDDSLELPQASVLRIVKAAVRIQIDFEGEKCRIFNLFDIWYFVALYHSLNFIGRL